MLGLLKFCRTKNLLQQLAAEQNAASSPAEKVEHDLKKQGCEIKEADLEWDDNVAPLGKGASGVVRLGTWLKSLPVAVKMLNNVPEFIDAANLQEIYKELSVCIHNVLFPYLFVVVKPASTSEVLPLFLTLLMQFKYCLLLWLGKEKRISMLSNRVRSMWRFKPLRF